LKKLLVPAIASILILGTLGMDQQSFGTLAGGDLNPPVTRDSDCSLTYAFTGNPLEPTPDTNPIHGGTCTKGPLNPDFPVSVVYKPALPEGVVTADDIPASQAVHLMLPNFIDNLDTKKVRIQVLYDPAFSTPSVKHPGGVKEDVNPGTPEVNPEICFRDGLPINSIPGYFFEDWTCHPNPINEVIWFDITGAVVLEIIVDTVSFGEPPVGGEIIPIESTSLLLASTQSFSWMIPLGLSGIGIGLFVVSRKSDELSKGLEN
jgi:hypothetical protein